MRYLPLLAWGALSLAAGVVVGSCLPDPFDMFFAGLVCYFAGAMASMHSVRRELRRPRPQTRFRP